MFRKNSFPSRLAIATALALGASGVALADDNSMSRFGGSSYAYFSDMGNAAATSALRQVHPRAPTERELQAFSSSGLSAVVAQVDPSIVSTAAADPAWRQTHPNGFTERELLARSSSTLAMWQIPGVSAPGPRANVAEDASKGTLAAALKSFLQPGSATRTQ